MDQSKMTKRPAAFFRMEGTFLPRWDHRYLTHLAWNRQSFRERLLRIGEVGLFAPFQKAAQQHDPQFAIPALYKSLRGMSDDRIALLSQEFLEEVLTPQIYPQGQQLIERCRNDGFFIVFISEAIQHLAQPLSQRVGPPDYLACNGLEMKDGQATGTLKLPIIGGELTSAWLTEFAGQRQIDLSRSIAYGGSKSDSSLLSSVGHPCAVNPDFALLRAAKQAKWPVMEYRP